MRTKMIIWWWPSNDFYRPADCHFLNCLFLSPYIFLHTRSVIIGELSGSKYVYLNLLGKLPQLFCMLGRYCVKFAVGLIRRGLLGDERLKEVVEVGREVLVRQVGVLGQHVRGQVVVLVLAVQQQQVAECLGRERVLLQEELQLAEAVRGLGVNIHQSLEHGTYIR